MFGHHKDAVSSKKMEKNIPLEEIRKMASKGMTDRDIIKEFKGRGYSYNEIEKAMLAAVKEGVDEPSMPSEVPNAEEFFAQTAQPRQAMQPEFDLPTFEEEPAEPITPEQTENIMEELIEGVIEEKWNKFQDKMDVIDKSFEKIRSEMKQWEIRQEQQRGDSPTKELELRLSEISEQIEDIDARVGGLEKAFKQFLPALTRNIESLSQLIHELREKQDMVEEEA